MHGTVLVVVRVVATTRLSNQIWYCAPGALAVLLIDDSKFK